MFTFNKIGGCAHGQFLYDFQYLSESLKIPTPNILKSHAYGSTTIDIIGEKKKLKDEVIELVGKKPVFL